MSNNRSVVVTGLGVIAPGSFGIEEFWDNMTHGSVFTGPLRAFPHEGLRSPVSAEIVKSQAFLELAQRVRDSHPEEIRSKTQLLSIMGATMALEDGGLPVPDPGSHTFGLDTWSQKPVHIAVGTTMGVEDSLLSILPMETLKDPDTEILDRHAPDLVLEGIRKHFQLEHPTMRMFMNACAAGNYAIGSGWDEIRSGTCDLAIAGGVDALSFLAITGFNRLLSVTPDFCRPFDKSRKGIVVAEGAALLLLEEKEHAVKRGARIYAELSGYGLGVDAYHITSPSPDGRGAVQSMHRALEQAVLAPADIDYVSAHGTGTQANDAAECVALRAVFGEQTPPMSSIKSMIGHAMGAASAIEAVACCLMLQHQTLLPTMNLTELDERCPIDCVPNKSRSARLRHVMSNALAFGGNTSSVIFSVQSEPGTDCTIAPASTETASPAAAEILSVHTFPAEGLEHYLADHLTAYDTRAMDRQSQLLIAAIHHTLQSNGMSLEQLPKESTAIITGSRHAALRPSLEFLCSAIENGPLGTSPMAFPKTVGNAAASRASILFGLRDKIICLSDGVFLSGLDTLLTGILEVKKGSQLALACALEEDSAVIALIQRGSY